MRAWSLAPLLSGVLLSAPAFAQYPPAPAPANPPPSNTPAGGSTLSAGGLAPPTAVEAAPPPGGAPGAATPAATEQDLARADREDSGRGLEFVWLNGEVGVMHLGLGALSNKNLVDPNDIDTTQTGLVVGGGAGLRLVFLTVGARFRYLPLPSMKLWSLDLEGGIHAPFGALELSGALGLGYASVKLPGSHYDPVIASVGTARGFDARLSGGIDYYLTNMFSAGVNLSAELMLLNRSGGTRILDGGASGDAFNATYGKAGSSASGALAATAVFGLHF